MEKKNKN